MREELRDAVAERDSKDDFAADLHRAVRESIVSPQAVARAAARESHAADTNKSGAYQFSVWSGWPGADPMEREDVGN
jgi:hypothetical protein